MRFQFSLAGLFLLLTVAAIMTGMVVRLGWCWGIFASLLVIETAILAFGGLVFAFVAVRHRRPGWVVVLLIGVFFLGLAWGIAVMLWESRLFH